MISPLSGSLDWDGYAHTLDAAGVTTAQSTSSIGWTFTPGAKSGTPATTGGISNWAASTWTDSNTAGSGTAAAWVGHAFQRPTLAASNSSVTTTDAATVYIANAPLAGSNETLTSTWAMWVDAGDVRFDGNVYASGLRATAAMGFYIQGLTYANNSGDATNDIDIAIGMAVSNDAAQANRRSMVLTSALTKRLDATWAVGSGNGGLDTGAVGNNDYYIWLIMRSDTGVVDALFSLSATAPTMPASYDYKRLIGWFKRSGGANVAFNTYEEAGGGLDFRWTTPTLDVDLSNTLTTSRRTDAVKVPLDFSTMSILRIKIGDASSASINTFGCPDETDAAPSLTATPLVTIRGHSNETFAQQVTIRTSSTGTIFARSTLATVDNYQVLTLGFTWARRN